MRLGKGQLEVELLADHGAGVNFTSEIVLKEIEQKLLKNLNEPVNPAQLYREVRGGPCLSYHGIVKLDVILETRQGTSIMLRNIKCKVVKDDIKTLIM